MLLYSYIDNNIEKGRTSGMQLLSRFRFLLITYDQYLRKCE